VARFGRTFLHLTTALAVAGLAYGNWAAFSEQIDTSAPVTHDAAAVTVIQEPEKSDSKNLTLSDLAETLARPLFSATRRPVQKSDPAETPVAPVVATALAQAAPTESQVNLRLLGMMRASGGVQRALLQRDGGDSASWIAVGAEFGGWRLTSLDGDSASVESGGSKAVLKLHPSLVAQRSAN
jgi:hypothetical protein